MPTVIESNPISQMKKLVVKLEIYDDKAKQKALKTVSSLQGIDSIAVDMKERKLTVIGTVDPVNLVSKLRKYWQTDIVTVGPAVEPETKKEEPKPEGEQAKKEGGGDAAAGKEQQDPNKKPAEGGGGEGKPGGGDQQEKEKDEEKGGGGDGKRGEAGTDEMRRRIDPAGALELMRPYTAYRAYNNPQLTSANYYHVQSMEENPNACSIC